MRTAFFYLALGIFCAFLKPLRVDGLKEPSLSRRSSILDCKTEVTKWIATQDAVVRGERRSLPPSPIKEDGSSSLVFFLHIPRTAGRTLQNCLMASGTPPSKRCPPSYDFRRAQKSDRPPCSLLASHDDYSIMSTLPVDTVVVTTVRDPVSRMLSAYEWVVEIAQRDMMFDDAILQEKHQNITTRKENAMLTHKIWPWSVLLPWMRRDLIRRREARLAANKTLPQAGGDVYNSPSVVMPLHEFVSAPEVIATIANGNTLAVLGLTNYSLQAHLTSTLRECAGRGGSPAAALAEAATRRLASFRAVGIFDQLNSTVRLAAAALNLSFTGPAYTKPKENGSGDLPAGEEKDAGSGGGKNQDEPDISKEDIEKVIESARADLRKAQGTLKRASYAHYNSMAEKRAATDVLQESVARAQATLSVLEGKDAAPKEDPVKQTAKGRDGTAGGNNLNGLSLDAKWAAMDRAAMLVNKTLGSQFGACEYKGRERNMKRKHSLVNLRWADGTFFEYTKDVRKKIPMSITSLIKGSNVADSIVYEHAKAQHNRLLVKYANRIEDIPEFIPPPPKPTGPQPPVLPRPKELAPLAPTPEPPKVPHPGKMVFPPREQGDAAPKDKESYIYEIKEIEVRSSSPSTLRDIRGVARGVRRNTRRRKSNEEESEEEALLRRWRQADIQDEIHLSGEQEPALEDGRASEGVTNESNADTNTDRASQGLSSPQASEHPEITAPDAKYDPMSNAKKMMKTRMQKMREEQKDMPSSFATAQDRPISQAKTNSDVRVHGKNRAPGGPQIKVKSNWEHDEL